MNENVFPENENFSPRGFSLSVAVKKRQTLVAAATEQKLDAIKIFQFLFHLYTSFHIIFSLFLVNNVIFHVGFMQN